MRADFVDTNVLAYAFDQSSPAKQDRAREILADDFVLSAQVLSELHVTLTRKLAATAGCAVLLTEGLNTGATIRGVRIENPFACDG